MQNTALYMFLYVCAAGVVLLTVCGNLLVIISISHFKQLHTPTNFFILSLAMADLLVATTVMPFAFGILIETHWMFSEMLCLIFHMTGYFLTCVSIYSVAFIAVDRFLVLQDPFFYSSKITVNLAWCLIIDADMWKSYNASCSGEMQKTPLYVFLYVCAAGVVLLTVCGNMLVIISISHFKELHTPTNFFVFSLALADLLIGVMVMPFAFSVFIETNWVFSKAFCLSSSVTAFSLTCVSIYNVAFIAVDRFLVLSDPFFYSSKITVNLTFIYFSMLHYDISVHKNICPSKHTCKCHKIYCQKGIFNGFKEKEIIHGIRTKSCENTWDSTGVVLLTVCGNLLVIISISHFKQLHTPTNFFILSLAVADLLVGVTVMPFGLSTTIEVCWNFGRTFCVVYQIFTYYLTSVSLYNVIFIAVDRYLAVCNPFFYSAKITVNISLLIIFFIWCTSIFLNTVLYYFSTSITDTTNTTASLTVCSVTASDTWDIVDLLLVFIFPSVLMIILYIKIFIIARHHAKTIRCANKANTFHNTTEMKSMASEKKAAKTLGIVVAVFLLCLMPSFTVFVDPDVVSLTFYVEMQNITYAVLFLNSSINPIIYALFYPWFQKCVKLIVTF
ncbi:trace amine-associated receptor 3-like, partial [Scleropages formosus]